MDLQKFRQESIECSVQLAKMQKELLGVLLKYENYINKNIDLRVELVKYTEELSDDQIEEIQPTMNLIADEIERQCIKIISTEEIKKFDYLMYVIKNERRYNG